MSRNKAKTRVRTAKGRKISSTRWLQRQLNDPYIVKAETEGYRSRAAFKLVEINEKYDFLRKRQTVIDLGSAPGGWSQIAANMGCRVVGIDLLDVDPIDNVDFVQMDFMDDETPDVLKTMLNGKADIVLSDMAPNTTGHKQTDHLRIMNVVEAAYQFACEVLEQDGVFVAKVFQGGAQNTLLAEMKRTFKVVRHIKPPASRSDSSEQYLIASGFRGDN